MNNVSYVTQSVYSFLGTKPESQEPPTDGNELEKIIFQSLDIQYF